jgi:cytochrome c biogenesis protein CcdA
MRPHRFDALSFVFGFLFLGAVVMASTGTLDVSGQALSWIGAGALLFIGVMSLIGSRGGERRRFQSPDNED